MDLLALELCSSSPNPAHLLLTPSHSPLMPEAWGAALQHHPDRVFVCIRCLETGLRNGFHSTAPLRSPSRNMLSTLQHLEVAQSYLAKECALGRMLGPSPLSLTATLPPLHINHFGVIPKGHITSKWRLITDISFPPSFSVNDGIDPELCYLVYSSVERWQSPPPIPLVLSLPRMT